MADATEYRESLLAVYYRFVHNILLFFIYSAVLASDLSIISILRHLNLSYYRTRR